MHPAVADALDRWNAAHPWSHNDRYARWRDALAPGGALVVVGCCREATPAEVRACVARVLPGARVRRRLFWRWTLVHRASAAGVR